MEITASQSKDTLKMAPKFCKDNKIPTELKHTDLHTSIFPHKLSENKFCSQLTGKQLASYTTNFFFQFHSSNMEVCQGHLTSKITWKCVER
jgi:hypothetical protein